MENNGVETIKHNDEIIAIVLYSNYKKEGINFFTPNDFSQQFGVHRWEKGKFMAPHLHKVVKREIRYTQEFLFVKSGKVKLTLYTPNKDYIGERTLNVGDSVLLAFGGHSLELLEDSEIIEVKQGPYIDKENDKEIFNGQ